MDIYKLFDNYVEVLKKYAVFSGRAPRPEYWWFVFASLIISIALGTLDENLNNLYGILVFIPSLAVTVRRMHDVGHSGHYLWFMLLPIIGWILVIVQLAKRGQAGHNKYNLHHPQEA